MAPKGHLQCKRCQRFGHTQRNCGYVPRCVACGGAHLTGGCSTPREQPQCCGCGGNHTASYRDCIKWKEAKAALAKRATEGVRKSAVQANPPLLKPSVPGPLRSRRTWERPGITSNKGGVLSRTPPLHQILNALSRLRRPSRSLKLRQPGRWITTGLLEYWTRLENSLKISYWLGS